ncbi:hypothetical protein ACFUKV_22860 [Streptomyces paradoxus]|uniref:hypothetical protein n=1 Tax=Streptomyces paradoxus TaxID=66375 RepID=UPI0036397F8A
MVPVSAVTGVALSVLCGVLVLGDRPGAVAWLGIAVTVPALWFVAGGRAGAGKGTADGLVASLGVAVQYPALGQAGPGAGCGPSPRAGSPRSSCSCRTPHVMPDG